MRRLPAAVLHTLTRDIFMAYGVPANNATIVAEQLITASLMGVDSHGIALVPLYARFVREGAIVPDAPITVVEERGGVAVIECGHNFGQVGALRAVQVAINKAREHKIACVITRNASHTGRLGYYTQLAAQEGMLALATVNSPKAGHSVAPFGGKEGRLAPNPISYAVPGPTFPIVADVSTSTVAQGKVRLYRDRGKQLPEGWIIDADGNPTTNPADLYESPHGCLLPLGGSVAYKGFAFGLLAELLSGTLAGDIISQDKTPGSNGFCFIVTDISAFIPLERFRELVGEIVAYMKSTPLAPGFEEVLLPGELEFRTLAEREVLGIPIDTCTWQQIKETAEAAQVSVPDVWCD